MKRFLSFLLCITLLFGTAALSVNAFAAGTAAKTPSNKEIRALFRKKARKIERQENIEEVRIRYLEMTGDKFDEAVITYEHFDPVFTGIRVLTYKDGKVKTLLSLGAYLGYGIAFYRKTKTLVWHGGGHEDDWYDIYTLKGGRFKKVAGKYRAETWQKSWDSYSDGKNEITKKQYSAITKKLLKGKKTQIY